MDQTIKLDTRKRVSEVQIAPLRRGERNNALLTVRICANGQPYDLTGKTASLVATTAAGKLVGPCPMEVAEAGTARIMLPAALYSAVGVFSGYVEIRDGEALVDTTDRFGGKVLECADLDAEQAAEFTPLLGELQNAVAEEAKRAEAEKARTQAETERAAEFAEAKEAAQGATTAANDAAAGARNAAGSASAAAESANAAASKATDATAKAEAATETANAANTAAEAAVSDAQAAIAEVKATEAKLYPAAENILVGSETGAVAHVDDAFAGAALRKITVEGAVKQDGIPSPDAPKPITVIEHPAVKVVGRNLWPFASSYTSTKGHPNVFVKDKTPFTLLSGAYTFSAVGSLGNTDALLFGYTATGKRIQLFRILRNVTNPKYSFTVTEPITSVYFVSNESDSSIGTISNIQLERDSVATDYKPYTSQTLTFALPAEHPYLAKLPDGTADEIVVDGDGNVELVARVGKLVLDGDSTPLLNWQAQSNGYSLVYRRVLDASTLMNPEKFFSDNLRNVTEKYVPFDECAKEFGNIHFASNRNLCVGSGLADASQNAAVQAVNGWLNKHNATVYYALEAPKTYLLGKIEMPKAQDSIINAWTDAEVTPNTGIGYVRDVNIVVANIEKAIASITEG